MVEPTHEKWEVEKSDGEGDYTIWKHQILSQLEIQGLDSVLVLEGEPPVEKDLKEDPKTSAAKDKRVKNLTSTSLTDLVLRNEAHNCSILMGRSQKHNTKKQAI